MAPLHWLRLLPILCMGMWWGGGMFLQAQLSPVALPDDPPASHLYQASEGNLFFEKYQAEQLSRELQEFSAKHGFAIYLVTVNSPEKTVFVQLRQDIKRKWAARRDCMVMFYDLDTRLLALQFEPVYQAAEDRIARSMFSYEQEEAWVEFIDRWIKEKQQEDGLELVKILPFMRDFMQLLESQLVVTREAGKNPAGLFAGMAAVLLLGFLVFLRLRKRVAKPVSYLFPKVRVPYRLKAPHGGGLIAVHGFGPGEKRER